MDGMFSDPVGQDQSNNTNYYSVTPHFLTESEIAALIGNGYELVVVRGKACVADGWQRGGVTADRIKSERAAHPDALNTGVRTGAVVADDVDLTDPAEAAEMRRIGDEMLGRSPIERYGSKGSIAVYWNPTPIGKMAIKEPYTDEAGKHKVRALVEMLGTGNQFVAFGLHPTDGVGFYRYRDRTLLDVPADWNPLTTPDKMRACMMARFEWLKANGHPQAYVTGIDVDGFAKHRQSHGEDEIYERDYVEMLGRVDPDTDRDEWLCDLASQRGAPVIYDDGTPLSDDDLFRIAVRHSRGDLDHQGRYKAAPPASFSTSNSGQSLIGEESVEYTFWRLKPARPGQSNRTIGSLIDKAKKNGYAGFVTKLQRDLSKPHDPHSFDEVLKREAARREEPKAEQQNVKRGLKILRASDTKPRKLSWVWEYWIARSVLQLWAGVKATGKTTASISCASIVTRGGIWPDGTKAEQGDVLIWSGEDLWEETLLPRFTACGADLDHVYHVGPMVGGDERGVFERPFDPSTDMAELMEEASKIPNLKMVIIDPVILAVPDKADEKGNKAIRRGLQPLVHLAEKFKVAVIGIHHLTKNSHGKVVLDRITGSLAFTAGPRMIMAFTKGGDRRRMIRLEANIGPSGNGFDYLLSRLPVDVEDGGTTQGQFVEWGDLQIGDGQKLFDDIESGVHRKPLGQEEMRAVMFLQKYLSGAPQMYQDVVRDAREDGISYSTLHRARLRLQIEVGRDPTDQTSIWSLPRHDPNASSGANQVPF